MSICAFCGRPLRCLGCARTRFLLLFDKQLRILWATLWVSPNIIYIYCYKHLRFMWATLEVPGVRPKAILYCSLLAFARSVGDPCRTQGVPNYYLSLLVSSIWALYGRPLRCPYCVRTLFVIDCYKHLRIIWATLEVPCVCPKTIPH